MTNPKDVNLKSAYSFNCSQDRPRFRVEVSPEFHKILRERALQQGKHLKDLADEIFQAYFQTNPYVQDGFEEAAGRMMEE